MTIRPVCLLVVAWTMFPLSARTWTDIQGRKIEAELVRADGEKAIVRVGEKEVPLAIARLSTMDQKYLEEWKLANPSAPSSVEKFSLCGNELKTDGQITTIRVPLLSGAKHFLPGSSKDNPELLIGIALPAGFQPKIPQRVVWVAVNNLITFDTIDRHVVALNDYAKEATEAGWVVVAVDTKPYIPVTRGSTGDGIMNAKIAVIYNDTLEILTNEWSGFSASKFVFCGKDAGADSAQFLCGFMVKSKINVVGMFVSGRTSEYSQLVIDASHCKKEAYRSLKVFVSRAKAPWAQSSNIKNGPMEDNASEAHWKSNHDNVKVEYWEDEKTINKAGFRRALAWMIEAGDTKRQ